MSKTSLNFDNLKNSINFDKIEIDLDSLLYPTVIYIHPDEVVILNNNAHKLLGLKENQTFNIDKWKFNNPQIGNFLRGVNKHSMSDQRILITLFDGKKEIINFNLSIVERNNKRIHFIQFRKAANKYSVSSLSSLHSIKDKIKGLMPYLNNTGKAILKEILANNFQEGDKQSIADDLVYYEQEILIIEKLFPELSHHEVIICGLLIHDIDNNDISILTKRSLNSIFVTIHRINKKLMVRDRKELVEKLNNVIEIEKILQSNFRIIEDFDF